MIAVLIIKKLLWIFLNKIILYLIQQKCLTKLFCIYSLLIQAQVVNILSIISFSLHETSRVISVCRGAVRLEFLVSQENFWLRLSLDSRWGIRSFYVILSLFDQQTITPPSNRGNQISCGKIRGKIR